MEGLKAAVGLWKSVAGTVMGDSEGIPMGRSKIVSFRMEERMSVQLAGPRIRAQEKCRNNGTTLATRLPEETPTDTRNVDDGRGKVRERLSWEIQGILGQ